MDKHPIEKGIDDVVKTYELLDRIRLGRDLVIRDDQFEPEALLDAARFARSKGIRLSLLDTGRFEPSGLEWFIREGVRFYTSDEARPSEPELARLLKACRSARTFLAYFQNGPLQTQPAAGSVSLEGLKGLTSAGMDLHISDRAYGRDSGTLAELAENAAAGRGYFIYYHHGPLTPELAELAAAGAWIHFPDRSLNAENASGMALEIARGARRAGSRAVVYVEAGLSLPVLEGLFAAGAAVLFRTPPGDRNSPLRTFEQKARKREVPARAFYLTTMFLP